MIAVICVLNAIITVLHNEIVTVTNRYKRMLFVHKVMSLLVTKACNVLYYLLL